MVGDLFQTSLASLHSENEADDIAGRIGEHGQLRAARHFGWRQDRLAAEVLHFIEGCLQVVDLGVHRNALAAVLACGPAAPNSSPAVAGIDHAALYRGVSV